MVTLHWLSPSAAINVLEWEVYPQYAELARERIYQNSLQYIELHSTLLQSTDIQYNLLQFTHIY